MSSHSYKFLCHSCGASMEGEINKEMSVKEKCFCGQTMDMIYHMWPNGEYWVAKYLTESVDD